VTKAALCVHCWDIVSPRREWRIDRSWRWCECEHTAVRWRDGDKGLLEVSSLHGPIGVRVIGINNLFLQSAISDNPQAADGCRSSEQWRALHDLACDRAAPHYLFHKDQRACWALVVRVGESGDVTFVDYATARVRVPPSVGAVAAEITPTPPAPSDTHTLGQQPNPTP